MASTNYELGSSTRLNENRSCDFLTHNVEGGFPLLFAYYSCMLLSGVYFWRKFNTYNKLPRIAGTFFMASTFSGIFHSFVAANIYTNANKLDVQYEYQSRTRQGINNLF